MTKLQLGWIRHWRVCMLFGRWTGYRPVPDAQGPGYVK